MIIPERVSRPVRGWLENRFFLRLRSCPSCGTHDHGEPRMQSGRTRWERDGEPGVTEMRSSIWYFITCPQCQHQYAYLMWEADLFDEDYPPFHLAGPAPSQVISPHEFIAEMFRFASQWRPEVMSLPKLPDMGFVADAVKCCNELLKFFPDGVDEIPAEHFWSAEALAARQANPEHYTRAFVLGYHTEFTKHWARIEARWATEESARVAAGVVANATQKEPTRIPGLGLSDAAVRWHERWLDDKGGQRLEAKDVEASERELSTRNLTGAIIENCALDRSDLSFARLHGAKLTDTRLRDADLNSTMIAGTTLTRCTFAGSSMVIANLGDAEITDCDFSNTDLDRSSWYRSIVTRCKFTGSRLTDAPIDKAVFTDCDFRGVDFGHGRFDICTATDVSFVRCDLRETHWLDRDMFRARFIGCKLAGVHGRPNLTEATFEDPDLSPAGDGSQIATWREALALWGIDPDHPRAGLNWHKCYTLTVAEYEIAKPHLASFGFKVESESTHHGKVWLDGRDLIDDPAGPKLDALLAAHRESVKPPPTVRELKDAALAQEIIDSSIDAGLSFEDTIFALLKQGFTRDEAMTAMTRPLAPAG